MWWEFLFFKPFRNFLYFCGWQLNDDDPPIHGKIGVDNPPQTPLVRAKTATCCVHQRAISRHGEGARYAHHRTCGQLQFEGAVRRAHPDREARQEHRPVGLFHRAGAAVAAAGDGLRVSRPRAHLESPVRHRLDCLGGLAICHHADALPHHFRRVLRGVAGAAHHHPKKILQDKFILTNHLKLPNGM